MKNLSVIIPTLQKDIETLNNLVSRLVVDEVVKEVLIIDNSLKGYSFKNKKVRVIIPKENLFVNLSWNLGVREAQNEYICLANDDIGIPNNFCTKVLEKFSDDFGIVGMNNFDVINTKNKNNDIVIQIDNEELEKSKDISFKPITFRPDSFGIMMFFKKENYVEIPEDLKIFYGDDWVIYQARKKGKYNQVCTGQKIYHLGSLSSNKFTGLVNEERKKYLKHILPNYKRLLCHVETCTHNVWFVLGIMISLRKRVA